MGIYICDLELGRVPLIAGVLTDTDVTTTKRDLLNPADLIELRVDMFEETSLDHIVGIFRIAKENFKKPIIATVRDIKEGGQKEISDRLSIYWAVVRLSDAMDVEIGSGDLIKEVKGLCSAHGRLLIGSYHNFELTPDDSILDSIVAQGRKAGADIVKIAVTAKDREDLVRLMLFTHRHREAGIITMSMGSAGLPSRVFNPLFGSLITYGYTSRPSAPGQLSVGELMYIFRRLKMR